MLETKRNNITTKPLTTQVKPIIPICIDDYLSGSLTLTKKQIRQSAIDNTGGLSRVTKMRMFNSDNRLIQILGYNIPATECKVGKILVNVKGSTCNGCYALGGNYQRYGHNKPGSKLYERLDHVLNNPLWKYAMVYLIKNESRLDFFRWHDAGDIQNYKHLENIIWIANQLPNINFWLPSREQSRIQKYIESGNEIPANLNIRMSAYMVDAKPPKFRISGFTTSTVVKDKTPDYKTWLCPATVKDNPKYCGNCTACWNSKIPNVSYNFH